ncbi:MAG: geranylgeranyl reductase family protein [Syntrophothermus sp.]
MNFDVIIIGAGPAGCSAALHLAAGGAKVAVLEKSIVPGQKICGDALSGTVMNALKRFPGSAYDDFLKIPGKVPSWGIRFYSPAGEHLDVPFVQHKKPDTPVPGFLCSRKDFDLFLHQQLNKFSNIHFIPGIEVKEVTTETGKVVVRSADGEWTARAVIGADGVNSKVAGCLSGDNKDKIPLCLGARTYFTGVTGLHPGNFIELFFFRDFLPGYLWIFPMAGGMANVGVGMLSTDVKKRKIHLSGRLHDLISDHPLLRERFSEAKQVGKTGAHTLPMGPSSIRISGNRFLLAGDAAALVDPFTGEGIGNAMISGEIAAGILLKALVKNDFSAESLSEYGEMIRKKLFDELNTSKKLQQLARYPWLFNFVVKQVNKKPSRQQLFTRMYTDLEIRKKLKNPGFYLNLLLR